MLSQDATPDDVAAQRAAMRRGSLRVLAGAEAHASAVTPDSARSLTRGHARELVGEAAEAGMEVDPRLARQELMVALQLRAASLADAVALVEREAHALRASMRQEEEARARQLQLLREEHARVAQQACADMEALRAQREARRQRQLRSMAEQLDAAEAQEQQLMKEQLQKAEALLETQRRLARGGSCVRVAAHVLAAAASFVWRLVTAPLLPAATAVATATQ